VGFRKGNMSQSRWFVVPHAFCLAYSRSIMARKGCLEQSRRLSAMEQKTMDTSTLDESSVYMVEFASLGQHASALEHVGQCSHSLIQ
jgi:hypothetical protein